MKYLESSEVFDGVRPIVLSYEEGDDTIHTATYNVMRYTSNGATFQDGVTERVVETTYTFAPVSF